MHTNEINLSTGGHSDESDPKSKALFESAMAVNHAVADLQNTIDEEFTGRKRKSLPEEYESSLTNPKRHNRGSNSFDDMVTSKRARKVAQQRK